MDFLQYYEEPLRMAQRIRFDQLVSITGAATAADDEFPIWDTSASQNKSITRTELVNALQTLVDHGALAGLSDDDHTIYIKVDGTRAFTGEVAGITPTADASLATKGYVDGRIEGLRGKGTARVLADANVDLAVAADPSPIDGVTLSDGDVVLLNGQTTGSENGLYTAVTAADPTTWTRTDSLATGSIADNAFVFVEEGTSYKDTRWWVTADSVVIGTTAYTWSRFSGLSEITAGTYLSKSGNTLNVGLSFGSEGVGESGGQVVLLFGNLNATGTPDPAADLLAYWDDDASDHKAKTFDAFLELADGDKIDVDFAPSNYTPDATPAEASDVDDLAAHLQGIDTALAQVQANTNYIINGGMDVWQRGTSFAFSTATGGTYSADRMVVAAETAAGFDVDRIDASSSRYAMQITSGGDRYMVGQKIEGIFCRHLRSQKAALQARVRSSTTATIYYAIMEWGGTEDAPDDVPISSWGTDSTQTYKASWTQRVAGSVTLAANTWTDLDSISATLGAAFNNLMVIFWTDSLASTETFDISEVQLVKGTSVPDWQPRDPATTAVLCRRYYRTFADGIIAIGASGGSEIAVAMEFEAPMRAIPTASLLDTSVRIHDPGVTFRTSSGSTIVASELRAGGVRVSFGGFSGVTQGAAYDVENQGTSWLELDAEI